MRDVDQESGLILFTSALKGCQIWGVTIHRKDTFGDNQDRVLRVNGSDTPQLPEESVGREMPYAMHIVSCSHGSLDAAIVCVLVEDYMVLASYQACDDAVSSRPAGWEQDNMWESEHLRNGFLKL